MPSSRAAWAIVSAVCPVLTMFLKAIPAVAVELPERPEPRDRWLTRTEAAHLIRSARTAQARLYMPLFILLGLYTGRRKEAILSLRWPQVDLATGRIDFEVAGRRRTNKKRGVIQIPPRLLPHLRRARKRGTDLGYVLHINGNRIKDLKRGFAAACDRAGLEGVSPHTLRHTAATWLMQSGTDIWQASGFLSMSMETLQRVMGTTTRTISERLPRTSVGVRRMSA